MSSYTKRTKEYQSQRNKYTIAAWPAVGEVNHECGEEHWWDVRGKCVMCGIDRTALDAASDMVSEGGPVE